MSTRTNQTPLSSLAVPSRGFSGRAYVVIATLIVLVSIPPVVAVLDEPFYLDLVTRLMIFAIAAVSLDIVLGYGGMISFGHAAYLGIGGYAVGIFSFYGIDNGFLQWPVAIGCPHYRCDQSAHERHVFHHDYARFYTDALFPGD